MWNTNTSRGIESVRKCPTEEIQTMHRSSCGWRWKAVPLVETSWTILLQTTDITKSLQISGGLTFCSFSQVYKIYFASYQLLSLFFLSFSFPSFFLFFPFFLSFSLFLFLSLSLFLSFSLPPSPSSQPALGQREVPAEAGASVPITCPGTHRVPGEAALRVLCGCVFAQEAGRGCLRARTHPTVPSEGNRVARSLWPARVLTITLLGLMNWGRCGSLRNT